VLLTSFLLRLRWFIVADILAFTRRRAFERACLDLNQARGGSHFAAGLTDSALPGSGSIRMFLITILISINIIQHTVRYRQISL